MLNKAQLDEDLEKNWAVVAEAIQTILRRENYPKPYESLKELTRGKGKIDKQAIHPIHRYPAGTPGGKRRTKTGNAAELYRDYG